MRPIGESFADRFWRKVRKTDTCWIWIGATTDGYGEFAARRIYGRSGRRYQMVKAHRYAYEFVIGPIPAGLVLDHLCGNKLCVNPDHLEPVTPAENSRRGRPRPATYVMRGPVQLPLFDHEAV